ncbi:hypothetical protein EDD15DRAFT_2190624 [Pisolithus albus]|nr:hypothetical protein EDD15DRAFT_2190624 [Pisolithus albus]
MRLCICKTGCISPRKLLRDTTECIRRDSSFYDVPAYMGIPGEFGVILIGGLIAAILYGITTLQGRFNWSTYLYFMHHSGDDGLTMKLVVAAVCGPYVELLPGETNSSTPCNRRTDSLQIVNYGVPSSLEYIVWSFPASGLANTFVLVIFQCLPPPTKVVGDCPNSKASVSDRIVADAIGAHSRRFVNNAVSSASSTRVVSLTENLLQLLMNPSFMARPVVVAELAVAIAGKAAWSMGLNFIIGKSSLNTRQYLRSQESSVGPRQIVDVIRFAKPHKSSSDVESSCNAKRHVDVHGRF